MRRRASGGSETSEEEEEEKEKKQEQGTKEKLKEIYNFREIVIAATAVVRRQIRIVTDLAERLVSCDESIQYPLLKGNNEEFKAPRASKNIIKLPSASKQPESMPFALYVLDQAAENRCKALKELEAIQAQVRKAYKSVSFFSRV